MSDAAPLSNRLGKRLGANTTRTGLPVPGAKGAEPAKVTTTRGTDELLARAREAEVEEGGVDHSTLSTLHARLREV